MTIEQLLLLGIFVLASLLNLIVQAVRRRQQQRGTPEAVSTPPAHPGTRVPPSVVSREPRPPTPRAVPRRRASGPREPLAAPPGRQRRRPRVRFRTAADARRAFVLMTVLGPCRGLEPPTLVRR